ncbi:MAG TPA: hypothetical protein VGV15_22810 [Terriglobales bacterium]|nr:hypothetical protein [Terriglobales bacterium]
MYNQQISEVSRIQITQGLRPAAAKVLSSALILIKPDKVGVELNGELSAKVYCRPYSLRGTCSQALSSAANEWG